MNKKNSIFKRFQLFDYIILASFSLLTVAFFIFFFRKSHYLTVKVKITEKNILYANTDSPSWFAYLFKKGMKEKDGLGRVKAEVMDVYFYDNSIDKKAVYLTLKLKTTYNNRTGENKYEGTSVVIGEGLRIKLEKILVEGLIVEIEGLKNPYEEVNFLVQAKLLDYNSTFSETTGVENFISDNINIGDKVFDSNNQIVAEIVDKKVYPAQKNTFDNSGNVYGKFDPRLKDVFLTIKLTTKKINNEYFFLDDISLKTNRTIPLHLQNISVWPMITEISEIK